MLLFVNMLCVGWSCKVLYSHFVTKDSKPPWRVVASPLTQFIEWFTLEVLVASVACRRWAQVNAVKVGAEGLLLAADGIASHTERSRQRACFRDQGGGGQVALSKAVRTTAWWYFISKLEKSWPRALARQMLLAVHVAGRETGCKPSSVPAQESTGGRTKVLHSVATALFAPLTEPQVSCRRKGKTTQRVSDSQKHL